LVYPDLGTAVPVAAATDISNGQQLDANLGVAVPVVAGAVLVVVCGTGMAILASIGNAVLTTFDMVIVITIEAQSLRQLDADLAHAVPYAVTIGLPILTTIGIEYQRQFNIDLHVAVEMLATIDKQFNAGRDVARDIERGDHRTTADPRPARSAIRSATAGRTRYLREICWPASVAGLPTTAVRGPIREGLELR
jgi:hypothetical protein